MDPMMVESTRVAAPQRRSVAAVVRAPLAFFGLAGVRMCLKVVLATWDVLNAR